MWTTITHFSVTYLRQSGLAALLVFVAMLSLHMGPASARTGIEFGLRTQPQVQEDTREWRMVQQAGVLPLETVLGIARREIGGGELLEVDFNDRTGVYRLKMLRPNDSVVVVVVDGKTGRVLQIRGR